jgi:N-methylhydantoinase A
MFGMSLLEVAQGIIDIANANMIHALRLVSVQKGHDLRRFALVAFGGAGPLHAGRLARMLHIPRIIVPPFSSGFSALGCLVSDVRIDSVLTYRRRLDDLNAAELAEAFLPMEKDAQHRLTDEGYAVSEIELQHACDLRYVGQKYELTIPLTDNPQHCNVDDLHRDYQRRHEAMYAYATAEPVECINLRLVAQVPRQDFRLPPRATKGLEDARVEERKAFFPETGQVSMPVYLRERLGSGVGLRGPAIVEDEWSTTLVYPGQHLLVDQSGALIIEDNS